MSEGNNIALPAFLQDGSFFWAEFGKKAEWQLVYKTLLGQTVTGRKANKYDEEKRKQEEGCQAETCQIL